MPRTRRDHMTISFFGVCALVISRSRPVFLHQPRVSGPLETRYAPGNINHLSRQILRPSPKFPEAERVRRAPVSSEALYDHSWHVHEIAPESANGCPGGNWANDSGAECQATQLRDSHAHAAALFQSTTPQL
jgi:hypothetical protein